jgi:mono/diheme cytochrome c family protein
MVLRIVVLFTAGTLLLSCGEEKKSKTVKWDETESDAAPDPQATYLINCSSCHGEDGKLGASQAADLSKSTLSDKEILKMINEGNDKGMMPYKDLIPEAERKALVPYVKTLRK